MIEKLDKNYTLGDMGRKINELVETVNKFAEIWNNQDKYPRDFDNPHND